MEALSRPRLGSLYAAKVSIIDGRFVESVIPADLNTRTPEANTVLSSLAVSMLLLKPVGASYSFSKPFMTEDPVIASMRRKLDGQRLNTYEAFNDAVEEPDSKHFDVLFREVGKLCPMVENFLNAVGAEAKKCESQSSVLHFEDSRARYMHALSGLEIELMTYDLSDLAQIHRSESHE